MSHRNCWAGTALFAILLAGAGHSASAQSAADAKVDLQSACAQNAQSAACVSALLERIQQLEQRLHDVENKQAAAPVAAGAAAPTAVASEPAMADAMPGMGESLGIPKMEIRGFGHVNFSTIDHQSSVIGTSSPNLATSTFTLGNLDLFITSKISEKFTFLSEVNFEAGLDNTIGVDLERLMVTYDHSDAFKLSIGRFHSGIGYYNTAFHHSAWLQTTLGRPRLFEFEDSGGILPVHNVGLSATGLLPSGKWGLHYIAEFGNGQTSHNTIDQTVQNVIDENNGKSTNLAFYLKPQFLSGFQTGFSWYHDQLTPTGLDKLKEDIFAVHAVYVTTNFEFLNEGILLQRHDEVTGTDYHTPAFYTQISRQWGKYRPYFRYQYINAPNHEPVIGDVKLYAGPSAGLRWDASTFLAFKMQYDRISRRAQPATNGLGLQVSFTF